jgi:hypothetical protein
MSLEIALVNLAAWSVQVAVLALAAAAASRWLPLERPAARLAFSQALLAGILLLPLVQPWRAVSAAVLWSATLARPALAGHAGAGTATPAPPGWPLLVALVLTAGVLVQLGRLALGLARLRTLSRGAAPLEPPPWLDALRREIAPRTAFVVCAEAVSPATCGLRRPTVLLPRLFLDLGREQQRAIALHELLHVRRGDWAVQVGEELVRAALFFHPAVRWLIARVRLAREQAVDAEAVSRLGGRDAYLQSLVAVARAAASSRAVPAAPFLRESHLRERVDQLMKEGLMSRTRTILHLGAAVAGVVLAVSYTANAVPLQATTPAAGPTVNLSEDTGEKDLKLVHKVNPAYPADAKAGKVEGVFAIDVVIAKDGTIRDAHVVASAPTPERLKLVAAQKGTAAALEGDARLAEAATSAVRQWRYEPIVREGRPVEAKATVTVRFMIS